VTGKYVPRQRNCCRWSAHTGESASKERCKRTGRKLKTVNKGH